MTLEQDILIVVLSAIGAFVSWYLIVKFTPSIEGGS